jgi:hypothetical protein
MDSCGETSQSWATQPIHDKVQNHQLFKKGEIQVLLSFFLSFFHSFIHSLT